MNFRRFISTKSHTVTTLQRLMLYRVWVCITQNKTSLKKLSFTSKGQVRSSQRRSNGSLWLQAVTDAWTFSMRLSRCTRRSTLTTQITLIVSKDWFRSGKTWEWNTSNSARNWWLLIVKKKPRDSMNTHKTHKLTRDSRLTTSSSWALHQLHRYRKCPTWVTFLDLPISVGCKQPPNVRKKKMAAGETLQLCSIELNRLYKP